MDGAVCYEVGFGGNKLIVVIGGLYEIYRAYVVGGL